MISDYEITYLTDAAASDEARDGLDSAIDGLISEAGGSIVSSTPHQRRRLFYPISKKVAASSRTLQIQVDSLKIDDIRTAVKKKDGVLRLALLNTPARAEVTVDMLMQHTRDAREVAKPAKKVTMEEVEEKIEEALTEEVK